MVSKKHISNGGKQVKEGFVFTSSPNDKWLDVNELKRLVDES